MNDDELIERLRRTLHERAEALRPEPGQLPGGGPVPDWLAMRSTDATGGAGGPAGGPGQNPARDAGAHGPDPQGTDPLRERQTAEYAVLPPTGPVPIVGRRRRRWPPVAGAATLLAAAAAIVTAVALSGRSHPVTVQQGRNAPSTTAIPSPTTVPAPVTTLYPPKPAPGVTSSGRPAVPAGFRPASVTFVSAEDGWVLGEIPSHGGRCAALAKTVDGGYTWSEVGAPPVLSCDVSPAQTATQMNVRFADHADGWVWTQLDGVPSRLWSTHDGGTTWNQVAVPLDGATIGDLEAAGGQVHMVVYGPCRQGSAGCQGQTVEQILSSPATSDSWKAAPLSPSIGAGPVLSPSLTLWGRSGWLVNDNRTVVSGASRTAAGWVSWTPACSSANGSGLLAAASAQDLVAVCAEGTWGTPDAGMQAGRDYLFRSADAGGSWTALGQVPGHQPLSATTPAGDPETVVVADGDQGLQATFDGGANWYTMEPGPATANTAAGGYVFDYVGFTTATQGVAIASQPEPAMFMTRDGGHSWEPLSF